VPEPRQRTDELEAFVKEWLRWANAISPYRIRMQLEDDACKLLGIDPELTADPSKVSELKEALGENREAI